MSDYILHHIKATLLAIVIVTMVSCSSHRYPYRLLAIDSLAESRPDSALQLLEGMRSEIYEARESEQMYYCLSLANAQNKAYAPMLSTDTLKHTVDYFNRHGNNNERMRAYYLLGCAYRDLENAPAALQCFHSAITVADTLSADCDWLLLARTNAQAAALFYDERSPKNRIMYYESARKNFAKSNASLDVIACEEHIGGAYCDMGNWEHGLKHLQIARESYLKMGRRDMAASILCSFINYYTQIGDYKQAKKMITEFEAFSDFYVNGELPLEHNMYYVYKGRYYTGVGQLDSAVIQYRKLLSSPYQEDHEEVYKGLLSVYTKKHESDSISKYTALCMKLNDSLTVAKSAKKLDSLQTVFNYQLSEKNSSKGNGIIFSLVGCIIIILGWTTYKYTNKKWRIFTKTSNEEARPDTNTPTTKTHSNDAPQNLLKVRSCPIVVTFQKLAEKGKHPQIEEWTEFDTEMARLLPSLFQTFQQAPYTLTLKEQRVCYLLKLSFSAKSIALLLSTTAPNISNIKRNINQKLFSETGARTLEANISTL